MKSSRNPGATVTTLGGIDVLVEAAGDGCDQVQAFIRQRYAAEYGARVLHFMPRLFAHHRADLGLIGAFGLRSADQALFLERYLDGPIESALASRVGARVHRRQVVEVGQFAGTRAGAVRAMIVGLTARLHNEGYRWVVFTGTAGLRNAFRRLGLDPVDVARADPTRLTPDELIQWGTYYQCHPRVQFGDISEGYAALSRIRRSSDS